jgi:Flp pilus assembly pilin Flp
VWPPFVSADEIVENSRDFLYLKPLKVHRLATFAPHTDGIDKEQISLRSVDMTTFLNKFWRDEDGAITVDWVVLTALAVALSLLVLGIIQTGSVDTIVQMWADVDTGIAAIN